MMKNNKLGKLLSVGVASALMVTCFAPLAFAEGSQTDAATSVVTPTTQFTVRVAAVEAYAASYDTALNVIDVDKTKENDENWAAATSNCIDYEVKGYTGEDGKVVYTTPDLDLADIAFTGVYSWTGKGLYGSGYRKSCAGLSASVSVSRSYRSRGRSSKGLPFERGKRD